MSDPYAFLQRISQCIASSQDVITASGVDQQSEADNLRDLVEQVTDAFVELAHHYLPTLDHQTLENSWVEVRHRIYHFLLLRDEQSRRLREQLGEASSLRSKLQAELDELCDQMERGKLDLMSKTGNVKKMLRLDPNVAACTEAIQRVDQEIERGIAQLEIAENDARKKLPDYEACSLFNYLKDRHYGTPRYNESGIERRWDRWVAKLIDYEMSKSSYEYLTNTPDHLAKLINKKQDRYKSLLIQLEKAQTHAITKFGTDRQNQLLANIDRNVQLLKPRVQEAKQNESRIQAELAELNSLDGEHYQKAIKVYEAFLRQLNPEILSVYAACTESPIDDEICARLRNIRETMVRTQRSSTQLSKTIAVQETIVAALQEVSKLMRAYVRLAESDLVLDDRLCFDDWINDVKIDATNNRLTSIQAWRQVRTAIHRSEFPESSHSPVMPVEATFLAASSLNSDRGDITEHVNDDVQLQSNVDGMDDAVPENEFRLLAKCKHQADAAYLASLLDAVSIACFIHDGWTPGASNFLVSDGAADPIHVMVRAKQFDRAKSIVEKWDRE